MRSSRIATSPRMRCAAHLPYGNIHPRIQRSASRAWKTFSRPARRRAAMRKKPHVSCTFRHLTPRHRRPQENARNRADTIRFERMPTRYFQHRASGARCRMHDLAAPARHVETDIAFPGEATQEKAPAFAWASVIARSDFDGSERDAPTVDAAGIGIGVVVDAQPPVAVDVSDDRFTLQVAMMLSALLPVRSADLSLGRSIGGLAGSRRFQTGSRTTMSAPPHRPTPCRATPQ